jgi:hypothetical protein
MPIVVANGGAPRIVVVNQTSTVGTVQARTSAVQVPDQGVALGTVTQVREVVQVVSAGPQGEQGVPGLSPAGVYPAINFAFGDATPTPVLTLGENSEITGVSLQIEQIFDGAGAQIRLGTTGDPGLLLDAWQNDPAALMTFEASPRVELAAGTVIVLTIVPGGGASQGRGQFVITAVPAA